MSYGYLYLYRKLFKAFNTNLYYMVEILTERERKIIKKKLDGNSLTQNESNILSKSIRKKLREINKINSEVLLKKLEYNQKAKSIEEKIKKIVLGNVRDVEAIIVCGSVIQKNYTDYNDIDIIIATKKAIDLKKKSDLIEKIESIGRDENLKLDVQVYSKDSILNQYSNNPSLIYQLKDSKVIYGKLKIPSRISLSMLDLRMKLDWSDVNIQTDSVDILYAIRNAILVSLLMNKKVDNYELNNFMDNILGSELIERLKHNEITKSEKKLLLNFLKLLVNHLEKELKNRKWEKIEIENP